MRIGYIMEAGAPDVRESRPSGAASHVRHTIGELGRLGHEVRLVARLGGQIWASDDLQRFRPVYLAGLDDGPRRVTERIVRRVQSQLGLPYVAYFDSRRFAAACLRELSGSDLLYERMGWMGLGGMLAARRIGIPRVLEVNGDHLDELTMLGFKTRGLQRQVSMRLMARVARTATRTVATGEGWRTRHLQRWRIDPATVSVVQNGTDVVDLLARKQLRSFQCVSPPGSALHVAFVGSFDPWQGLPLLLRAARKVIASGRAMRLSLVGSGREEPGLRAMAGSLGLLDHVLFAGHLPAAQMASHLSRCDVGASLYTGRAEYTGLKILDYKAAGLATVATGEGGGPDLIQHEHTGLIIPPDDEDALCSALGRMHADLAWTRAMGRRARLEAEQRHRWCHTAVSLDAIFSAVTGRRPAPAEPPVLERLPGDHGVA